VKRPPKPDLVKASTSGPCSEPKLLGIPDSFFDSLFAPCSAQQSLSIPRCSPILRTGAKDLILDDKKGGGSNACLGQKSTE
jgi:hypothetical protein